MSEIFRDNARLGDAVRSMPEDTGLIHSGPTESGDPEMWGYVKIPKLLEFFDASIGSSPDEALAKLLPKGWMFPALESVLEERIRQDAKWGEQNHNPYIYLSILMEEVGELSQAILQSQFGGEHGGDKNVRKEAVHTAAVALAIIECLDRGLWHDDDVHLEGALFTLDEIRRRAEGAVDEVTA
jgi:NTP pyrophosphatase (non-canonical NTP hydrolase)